MKASKHMQQYFDHIESEVALLYNLAKEAREKGYDPEKKVDIPLAKGIAQRVEGLISAVSPQIMKSGVAQRIIELEQEYGSLDWRVALKIAEEVARQKFCTFESEQQAMETGIRVGLAYITLGVISAPLEGFVELKIKQTKNNKKYVSAFYAGPIRAAGGTAAAVSLIITDYVRKQLGYEKFDPTEKEVKRVMTEIYDYHERITNLQYLPSEDELSFLLARMPIEVNGDPTEDFEVSNYKDLERIETNRLRGGVCLVIAEGLSQKAPKLFKKIHKWGASMGLDWGFLEEFLSIQKRVKAKSKSKSTTEKITPNYTYIKDLVAGRPVIGFPMRKGGLRLRYGRTRTTGLAAAAIHPKTMYVLQDYIAVGTQLKVERPGKACAITTCDTIKAPIVKTKEGSVVDLGTAHVGLEHIESILYLGDILFNYGDFSENGHKLVPVGYCEEWWALEVKKAIPTPSKELQQLLNNPCKQIPSFANAYALSKEYNVPLHPHYTYFWNALSKEEFIQLYQWLKQAKVHQENGAIKLVLEKSPQKILLEQIGVPHLFVNQSFVVIQGDHAKAIYTLLMSHALKEKETILASLQATSGITQRDTMGTFIGARMGRPEKAKMRKLTGSPHFLFPVGEEGGRLRSVQSALDKKKITSVFASYFCSHCNEYALFSRCERCDQETELKPDVDKGSSINYKRRAINTKELVEHMMKRANISIFPDLIKGVRGTSNKDHIPEYFLKGVLRAKNEIYVNKDGTTRYDMIELPITHFTPEEIGTSIEQLKRLGYSHDCYQKPLTNINQVVELLPQDIILPACPDSADEPADHVLKRVADTIDDFLEVIYGMKRYYNISKYDDLLGQLVVGLAPHTSAGIVGRIIGFSKTQGMYCHPMMHAAMRRNCDGDEACVILLLDALLNFSRSFLPDRRGSRTMDAPLVLTSQLTPAEVDDEVHGMDIVWQYPLELYEAAAQYKNPWEIDIKQISDVLDKPEQYEGMGFTHDVSSINSGVLCSAYKILPSMQEKLTGQMQLAEKICAVHSGQVAQLVIEKHFIKDIRGNLRKFSTQQFRCVQCNEKYRRPPLRGICLQCNGKIIFTISEGSIVKYLEPSLSLAKAYDVSPYLQQTLEFLKDQIDSVLGREKELQTGLGSWF